MGNKIWKGRIEKNTDKTVDKFTCSIDVDKSLYLYDLTGTAAYAIGLNKIGIISDDELKKIIYGLKTVKKNIEEGSIDTGIYEDIHSLVESELGKIIGDAGMKIHTGRSRNDQVVLDEKLFVKDALIDIISKILALQGNILKIAESKIDIIIPAYTHMQKAQPVLLSHYFLSFFKKFERDTDNLFFNFETCDYMPLGAAACAGSGYKLDRKLLKELLEFKDLDSNSMDIVGNRDFIIDFIYSCSKIMLHLSRLCEDLIIYNTSEFSFIEIDEDFCTGSSIMPQKKNPDVLELIRGKSSLVIGSLMQSMILLKGLPSTYNRDLQEDKKILFSAYEETSASVEIFSKLLEKIKFNSIKINNALKEGFLEATDIADYLVKKGESFRKAHNIVGKIVRFCIDKKISFKDLEMEELKNYSPYFESDIHDMIEIQSCISSKKVECGTEKGQVILNIESGKKKIKDSGNKLKDLIKRTPKFEKIIKYIDA
ncbi:MAG: argininosuccinate lyase [Candidatus Hydromicrobium sp.]|nr:argininosuccinate lyase [Candidatus Hydromicrobium sp.]